MRTLCIDIGGTGIKGNVLDITGTALAERVRIETPRPATPTEVIATAVEVGRRLGAFDRISCGFPGVVEHGVVRTAPNLDGEWNGYPLADELEKRLGKPCRAANDADLHGLAAIEGHGVEMVLTLGTGMGSGLYIDGRCVWNLELGHHNYEGDETYEDRVSDAVRKKIGNKKWRRRVGAIVSRLAPIFNYRRLYLGGGNAARLIPADLPANVAIVDNKLGITGGLKLWAEDRTIVP
ncbi:MAG: ROK family protein [Polyangiaceae bacterium]|nr:ROK family protein [Polyangiaceae bacterium]